MTAKSAITGAMILAAAVAYNGHKYIFGGVSDPNGGWDCSSFASWVLGHQLGLPLPGGASWASATSNGSTHGPVASEFANLPGTHFVSHNAGDIQPGDILVWSTHVGFGVGPNKMFSAFDTAEGTLYTSATGPGGEQLSIYRYGAGTTGTPASGGSSTPASGSGGLLSFPSEITGFFTDANTFVTTLMWITKPEHWVRVVAFLAGIALLLFAIHALIAAANGEPLVKMPSSIPVPIPV